jgi:isopentenyl phosphate kinase
MDVTGGMSRKVQEATNISRMGLQVFFVNGNRPERIVNSVQKGKFEGTLFRGK